MEDFVNKFLEIKIFQKTFQGKLTITFNRFWALRGWGWGEAGESV